MNTKATGNIGEQRAAEYLQKHGYRIVERNAVYGDCEVDIIAEAYLDDEGKPVRESKLRTFLERAFKRKRKGERTLVFCEVKTRYGDSFGTGAEAVDKYKAGRYIVAAKTYQAAHGCVGGRVRFDIIEVGEDKINHIADAFNENDAKYSRRR